VKPWSFSHVGLDPRSVEVTGTMIGGRGSLNDVGENPSF